MEITETDFFDTLTIQNDQISYVKHVSAPLFAFFTLLGCLGGGGAPMGSSEIIVLSKAVRACLCNADPLAKFESSPSPGITTMADDWKSSRIGMRFPGLHSLSLFQPHATIVPLTKPLSWLKFHVMKWKN